jgi:GNAT superfamily N-acetyltransferase
MRITYIIHHPDYCATVADWYISFWGKNYPNRTNADWQAYIGKSVSKLPITLVAIDESTSPPSPVGTASIRLNGMDNCTPNTAWLSGVYVPDDHRGKGIATALIKEAIKVASEQYSQLYLFTRTDGRIYKNLGWKTTNKMEYQGHEVLVMTNTLTPKINWKFYSNQPIPKAPLQKITITATNQIKAKL